MGTAHEGAPLLILVTRPLVGMPGDGMGRASQGAGFAIADADEPQLSVLDLGVTRGDGVFETVMVAHRAAPALDAHLDRLERSARILDFPPLDILVWRGAVAEAISRHPPVDLLAVKLVLTRGIEGAGIPTAWVLARPAPDFADLRIRGLAAVTLDRGVPHDLAERSPWLPNGAKTLSYEVNSAALREARRRGAEDAVFVSSDGLVLEATTSSVLVRQGDRFRTPAPELGIVPGTTVRRAFGELESLGYEVQASRMPVSALHDADGLWLLSSIRRMVPVVALDGAPLPLDAELTAELNSRLGR